MCLTYAIVNGIRSKNPSLETTKSVVHAIAVSGIYLGHNFYTEHHGTPMKWSWIQALEVHSSRA